MMTSQAAVVPFLRYGGPEYDPGSCRARARRCQRCSGGEFHMKAARREVQNDGLTDDLTFPPSPLHVKILGRSKLSAPTPARTLVIAPHTRIVGLTMRSCQPSG
jgi:hypothetical protein